MLKAEEIAYICIFVPLLGRQVLILQFVGGCGSIFCALVHFQKISVVICCLCSSGVIKYFWCASAPGRWDSDKYCCKNDDR